MAGENFLNFNSNTYVPSTPVDTARNKSIELTPNNSSSNKTTNIPAATFEESKTRKAELMRQIAEHLRLIQNSADEMEINSHWLTNGFMWVQGKKTTAQTYSEYAKRLEELWQELHSGKQSTSAARKKFLEIMKESGIEVHDVTEAETGVADNIAWAFQQIKDLSATGFQIIFSKFVGDEFSFLGSIAYSNFLDFSSKVVEIAKETGKDVNDPSVLQKAQEAVMGENFMQNVKKSLQHWATAKFGKALPPELDRALASGFTCAFAELFSQIMGAFSEGKNPVTEIKLDKAAVSFALGFVAGKFIGGLEKKWASKEFPKEAAKANSNNSNTTKSNTNNKSDNTKSDTTKSDTTKSDTTKSDSTKSDTTKSDTTKSDTTKSDNTKSDNTKSDATKSDATKSDATKSDATKSDSKASDTKQAASNNQPQTNIPISSEAKNSKEILILLLEAHLDGTNGVLEELYSRWQNGDLKDLTFNDIRDLIGIYMQEAGSERISSTGHKNHHKDSSTIKNESNNNSESNINSGKAVPPAEKTDANPTIVSPKEKESTNSPRANKENDLVKPVENANRPVKIDNNSNTKVPDKTKSVDSINKDLPSNEPVKISTIKPSINAQNNIVSTNTPTKTTQTTNPIQQKILEYENKFKAGIKTPQDLKDYQRLVSEEAMKGLNPDTRELLNQAQKTQNEQGNQYIVKKLESDLLELQTKIATTTDTDRKANLKAEFDRKEITLQKIKDLEGVKRPDLVKASLASADEKVPFPHANEQDRNLLLNKDVESSFNRALFTNQKTNEKFHILRYPSDKVNISVFRILDSNGKLIVEKEIASDALPNVVIMDAFTNTPPINLIESFNEDLTHGEAVHLIARKNNPFANYHLLNVSTGAPKGFLGLEGRSIELEEGIKPLLEIHKEHNVDLVSVSIGSEFPFILIESILGIPINQDNIRENKELIRKALDEISQMDSNKLIERLERNNFWQKVGVENSMPNFMDTLTKEKRQQLNTAIVNMLEDILNSNKKIEQVADLGIPFFFAAGNEGNRSLNPYLLARGVEGVSSLDSDHKLSEFNSSGNLPTHQEIGEYQVMLSPDSTNLEFSGVYGYDIKLSDSWLQPFLNKPLQGMLLSEGELNNIKSSTDPNQELRKQKHKVIRVEDLAKIFPDNEIYKEALDKHPGTFVSIRGNKLLTVNDDGLLIPIVKKEKIKGTSFATPVAAAKKSLSIFLEKNFPEVIGSETENTNAIANTPTINNDTNGQISSVSQSTKNDPWSKFDKSSGTAKNESLGEVAPLERVAINQPLEDHIKAAQIADKIYSDENTPVRVYGNGFCVNKDSSATAKLIGNLLFPSYGLNRLSGTESNLPDYPLYGIHFLPTLKDGSIADASKKAPENEKDQIKLDAAIGLLKFIEDLQNGSYPSNGILHLRKINTKSGFYNLLIHRLGFREVMEDGRPAAIAQISDLVSNITAVKNNAHAYLQKLRAESSRNPQVAEELEVNPEDTLNIHHETKQKDDDNNAQTSSKKNRLQNLWEGLTDYDNSRINQVRMRMTGDFSKVDFVKHPELLKYLKKSLESGKKVNLRNANLEKVDLQAINLSKADLSNANLREANLSGAELTGANLDGANLSTAQLNGANLQNANFSNTRIEGVIGLDSAKGIETVNFSKAEPILRLKPGEVLLPKIFRNTNPINVNDYSSNVNTRIVQQTLVSVEDSPHANFFFLNLNPIRVGKDKKPEAISFSEVARTTPFEQIKPALQNHLSHAMFHLESSGRLGAIRGIWDLISLRSITNSFATENNQSNKIDEINQFNNFLMQSFFNRMVYVVNQKNPDQALLMELAVVSSVYKKLYPNNDYVSKAFDLVDSKLDKNPWGLLNGNIESQADELIKQLLENKNSDYVRLDGYSDNTRLAMQTYLKQLIEANNIAEIRNNTFTSVDNNLGVKIQRSASGLDCVITNISGHHFESTESISTLVKDLAIQLIGDELKAGTKENPKIIEKFPRLYIEYPSNSQDIKNKMIKAGTEGKLNMDFMPPTDFLEGSKFLIVGLESFIANHFEGKVISQETKTKKEEQQAEEEKRREIQTKIDKYKPTVSPDEISQVLLQFPNISEKVLKQIINELVDTGKYEQFIIRRSEEDSLFIYTRDSYRILNPKLLYDSTDNNEGMLRYEIDTLPLKDLLTYNRQIFEDIVQVLSQGYLEINRAKIPINNESSHQAQISIPPQKEVKIAGLEKKVKVLSYFDGFFTVQLPDGTTKKVAAENLLRLNPDLLPEGLEVGFFHGIFTVQLPDGETKRIATKDINLDEPPEELIKTPIEYLNKIKKYRLSGHEYDAQGKLHFIVYDPNDLSVRRISADEFFQTNKMIFRGEEFAKNNFHLIPVGTYMRWGVGEEGYFQKVADDKKHASMQKLDGTTKEVLTNDLIRMNANKLTGIPPLKAQIIDTKQKLSTPKVQFDFNFPKSIKLSSVDVKFLGLTSDRKRVQFELLQVKGSVVEAELDVVFDLYPQYAKKTTVQTDVISTRYLVNGFELIIPNDSPENGIRINHNKILGELNVWLMALPEPWQRSIKRIEIHPGEKGNAAADASSDGIIRFWEGEKNFNQAVFKHEMTHIIEGNIKRNYPLPDFIKYIQMLGEDLGGRLGLDSKLKLEKVSLNSIDILGDLTWQRIYKKLKAPSELLFYAIKNKEGAISGYLFFTPSESDHQVVSEHFSAGEYGITSLYSYLFLESFAPSMKYLLASAIDPGVTKYANSIVTGDEHVADFMGEGVFRSLIQPTPTMKAGISAYDGTLEEFAAPITEYLLDGSKDTDLQARDKWEEVLGKWRNLLREHNIRLEKNQRVGLVSAAGYDPTEPYSAYPSYHADDHLATLGNLSWRAFAENYPNLTREAIELITRFEGPNKDIPSSTIVGSGNDSVLAASNKANQNAEPSKSNIDTTESENSKLGNLNFSYANVDFRNNPQLMDELKERIRNNPDAQFDLSGADLRKQDLSNLDLRKTILKGARLAGTNLTNTKLPQNLEGVSLRNLDLTAIDLTEYNLKGADLDYAKLPIGKLPINLEEVSLLNTDLREFDLSQHNLRGSQIHRQGSIALLPDNPEKLPSKLSQWVDVDNPNKVVEFLTDTRQYDIYRKVIRSIQPQDMQAQMSKLFDNFWNDSIKKPSAFLQTLEELYFHANPGTREKTFQEIVQAINALPADPIKSVIQTTEKSIRKQLLNNLNSIVKMPNEVLSFWKDNVLTPSNKNNATNVRKNMAALAEIQVIASSLSPEESTRMINNFLTEEALKRSIQYPPSLVIANKINTLNHSTVNELIKLCDLDVSRIKPDDLIKAIPGLIKKKLETDSGLSNKLETFITSHGLRLSEKEKEKFFINNLNNTLQNQAEKVLLYTLDNSSFLKAILSPEEISKIKTLSDEQKLDYFRQFAYLNKTSEAGRKVLIPIIKRNLNSSLNISEANNELLKDFDTRFQTQYGSQINNMTWSEYMKTVYPDFKPSSIREEFTFTPSEAPLSFTVKSNPLDFLNMTKGLNDYACTEVGDSHYSLHAGQVTAFENGFIEVKDKNGNKIAFILFKVLPDRIDISKSYWYDKSANSPYKEYIDSSLGELEKALRKQFGMTNRIKKESYIQRNTIDNRDQGESEEIGGVKSYNERRIKQSNKS